MQARKQDQGDNSFFHGCSFVVFGNGANVVIMAVFGYCKARSFEMVIF
jgi:hypothetical protein